MFCKNNRVWVLGQTTLCCDISSPSSPKQSIDIDPALRGTKLSDTAVKQNLCASLSPGCQGKTSGMPPCDKRRLEAWFLCMLTFVSFHVLYGNSWDWSWFGDHKGSQRLSFRLHAQKMLLKHVKCIFVATWQKKILVFLLGWQKAATFIFSVNTYKK